VTEQPRFALVPAAYVYLLRPGTDGRTEVLLQQRGDVPFMAGHWAAAAAGHVEPGETAPVAALREALEELGLTSVDLEFVATMQRRRGDEAVEQRADFVFTARSWAGEPRIMEPTKAHRLGWFPLGDLPEPMVPHEAYVLGLLAAGAGDVPALLSFGF
jgi:8-oxo-dGTP diphosphatase